MLVSLNLGKAKNLRLNFVYMNVNLVGKDLPVLFFNSKGKSYPKGKVEPKHAYVTILICFISNDGATVTRLSELRLSL